MKTSTSDALKPRRERKANADRRRRQVLEATYRSVVKNGLARTTLATVASEAGLSQGVAVFYFKSKNGLLTEALRDLYCSYDTHWKAALAEAGDDPVDRLYAIISADFHENICNPAILSVWFAFWGEQKFTPQYASISRQFHETRSQVVGDICRKIFPEDASRAEDLSEWVDALTDGLWQNIHLFPQTYSNEVARKSTIRFLCAMIPDHKEKLRQLSGLA